MQNFLAVLFCVREIYSLHKFLFAFAWIGLLQIEKEFGNSHQEPSYLLDIDRI